jgi:uncharacterized phage-like protein YoqJ
VIYSGSGICLGITGHRPDKLGGYHDLSNLSAPIKFHMQCFFSEKNPLRIVSGMALGTDQWAVEMALDLEIKVLALIPCTNHDLMWPLHAQNKYRELLSRVEKSGGQVEYVSSGPYDPRCMHRRNVEIVERSTEMLAIWNGSKGGTSDCVRLARNACLPITVLNPITMKFEKDEEDDN